MRLNLATVGLDGYWTLFLSTLILLGTAGLGFFVLCRKVYSIAKSAPCTPQKRRTIVLVPGAALQANQVQAVFRSRLDRCIAVVNAGYAISPLILGGCTIGNRVSEAEAGKAYLVSQGIPGNAILTENRSTHTLENFQYGRELVSDRSEHSLLVSSRTHLWRCNVFAKSMGLNVDLCAAEQEFALNSKVLMRLLIEGLYLHWFYTGLYWSRLTSNRHSLKRIS